MEMEVDMVIHLNLGIFKKSIYYYQAKRKNNKIFGGFGVGHFGHRYIKIGKYDIVLWQVKKLKKVKPIHEQIDEMVKQVQLDTKQ
jgi:hypothetical protein